VSDRTRPNPVLNSEHNPLLSERPLRILSRRMVYAIDDALSDVGPFGEVRLIMNRGKVRFIETIQSRDLGPPSESE
jgi:hypothetical protein